MYFQVVGVACGAEHTLLLSVSGQVYGSGCNAYGQVCVCIQKTIYPYIVFFEKKKEKTLKSHYAVILSGSGIHFFWSPGSYPTKKNEYLY
jgi:alpha-tubulin suppressor-like RCC1 family protein